MRTNIVLDDSIMRTALKKGGFKTKKAAIMKKKHVRS